MSNIVFKETLLTEWKEAAETKALTKKKENKAMK